MRRNSLFGELGKGVFNKHSQNNGLAKFIKPIAEALVQVATLDREIEGLSEASKGSWLTPKRIITFLGVSAALLLVIGLAVILAPNGKGYTQLLINLDPAQREEFKIKIPKDVKALFAPGSAEDFIQSVTLINGKAQCWNPREVGDMSNISHLGDFYVFWPQAKLIPRKLWNVVYGQTENVTTKKEGIGAKRSIMIDVDYWTISCKDSNSRAAFF